MGDGYSLFSAQSFPCATLSSKKARKLMFGFVLVLALVLMTVGAPFAVMATAKTKSRRK
jgi:hypothetical protein